MAHTKSRTKKRPTKTVAKKTVKRRRQLSLPHLASASEKKNANVETVGIPGLIPPSEYDVRDELLRMDSFTYGRGNHE